MARRATVLALTIAYLAGQVSMVPHAHGVECGNCPTDHSARPHVHVGLIEHAGHSHDHNHEHDHSTRHNPDREQSRSANQEPLHTDHESDAVYLADGLGTSLLCKSISTPDASQVISSFVDAIIAPPTVLCNSATAAISHCACSSGYRLCLSLRALRL